MNYCSHCSGPVVFEIPPNDAEPRYVCHACETIHYENPKMVVGCIPLWQEAVLLCRRNIEPALGMWTLPAGYLECGETAAAGAARETLEETAGIVTDLQPYRLFEITHISQMYLMFLARLESDAVGQTPESSEVRFFHEKDIPWDSIAFPVIEKTLVSFFNDRARDDFSFKISRVTKRMK